MKPQTLLVDFDPDRVFVMQEQKAQIYNVNTDEAGNTVLQYGAVHVFPKSLVSDMLLG